MEVRDLTRLFLIIISAPNVGFKFILGALGQKCC